MELVLGNKKITLEDLISVTRRGYKVKISDEAYEKIDKARKLVDKYVEEGKVSYGITTGFGKFAEVSISKEQTGQLQKNIVMSHSCSVGNPLPIDIARGVVLLRAVNLAKGYSGARRIVVEKLVELLNKEVTPWIPEKGSVGSSGDLSPLAHMSLVLIGLGKAYYKGELLEAKDALAKAGIEPIPSLSSKEGLALTNGTQALTSTGAHVLYDAINLSKHLDIAASLTMESLHGIIDAYDPRISEVREHTGQINTAENMRKILAGSKNVTKQGVERVQDSYVLRCIPQIHGASKDTLEYVKKKVEEGRTLLMAALESPKGILNAYEIVTASDRMFGCAISGGDFRKSMHVQIEKGGIEMLTARGNMLLAARAAGVQCFDTMFPNVDDMEGFKEEVIQNRKMGFDGKSIISPKHIRFVHETFAPTPKEIAYAEKLINSFNEQADSGIGVYTVDGKMVDLPFFEDARRIIALAKACGVYQGNL